LLEQNLLEQNLLGQQSKHQNMYIAFRENWKEKDMTNESFWLQRKFFFNRCLSNMVPQISNDHMSKFKLLTSKLLTKLYTYTHT
jgi:hypothetical protein